MSFLKDRQYKIFYLFIAAVILCTILFGMLLWGNFGKLNKQKYLLDKQMMVSSLLEQGVEEGSILKALVNTDVTNESRIFLEKSGLSETTEIYFLPEVFGLQKELAGWMLGYGILLAGCLLTGTTVFFKSREQNYSQAVKIVDDFAEGNFSRHLPRFKEGELYRLYCSIDRLASMLYAQKETLKQAKDFLKDTVSDISHQLKTPLAALSMYNEIILEEAENKETVMIFSEKTDDTLDRIENLIQSLLKITRMDAGAVVFEKQDYLLSEIIKKAISNLLVRAEKEEKQIILQGPEETLLTCDFMWTREAIGNLVKNALDHTDPSGIITVSWENFPDKIRILVADDGCGIGKEDIYHIFKRFYRAAEKNKNIMGTGLGLPLAKSIIEKQGGMLAVESIPGEGTTFIITFLL